jgi:hypothetical protein
MTRVVIARRPYMVEFCGAGGRLEQVGKVSDIGEQVKKRGGNR